MNEDTVRIAKLQDLKELQNLQIDMEHTIEDEPYPDKLGKLGVEYILNIYTTLKQALLYYIILHYY